MAITREQLTIAGHKLFDMIAYAVQQYNQRNLPITRDTIVRSLVMLVQKLGVPPNYKGPNALLNILIDAKLLAEDEDHRLTWIGPDDLSAVTWPVPPDELFTEAQSGTTD